MEELQSIKYEGEKVESDSHNSSSETIQQEEEEEESKELILKKEDSSTSTPISKQTSPSIQPTSNKSNSKDLKGKGKATEEDEDEQNLMEVDVIEKEEEEEEEETEEEEELDDIEEILLATLPEAFIVGVNYYRGLNSLKKGATLELRRDKTNLSDRNSIEIRHSNRGAQIGNLQKSLASKLANLLDSKLISVVGTANVVPSNPVGVEKFTFELEIYGTAKMGKDERLDFAFPERVAKAEAKAAALIEVEKEKKRKVLEAKEMARSASDEGKNLDLLLKDSILVSGSHVDLLAELFKEGASDPSILPIHPCPPGKKDKSMRSELMPFQKQGLAWMIKMEHPQLPKEIDDPPAQLWVVKEDIKQEPFYFNLATGDTQRVKPVLKRGGILADEMGLGKTLQTIALIVTDDTGEGVISEPEDPDHRYDDMTLIVCPLSVASNWTDQFHHHVGSKRLKWHLYHGEGRAESKKELRKFDVIITTYQTLSGEHFAPVPSTTTTKPKEEGGGGGIKSEPKKPKSNKPIDGLLHAIKWRRVVLDEGHVIKNPKAKMSMACADLKAERRWILTGTPIINSTNDLGAMMTFLKMCRPLDERDKWSNFVELPIKNNSEEGRRILRAVVSSTTLRRTKDMTDAKGNLLVKLPKISFYVHKVPLNPETRLLYDEIAGSIKGVVKAMLREGQSGNGYSQVLVFLLRLRQLACDPALCPQSFISKVRDHLLSNEVDDELHRSGSTLPIPELQALLRSKMDIGEYCSICKQELLDPRIANCSHVFCFTCVKELIDLEGGFACCPDIPSHERLRHTLALDELHDKGAEIREGSEESEVLAFQAKEGVAGSIAAAKTRQLIEFLNATEVGVKSLVFSQWTSHLNCIEAALTDAGIISCRFDGSMTQTRRENVIATFSEPPSKKKLKKGEKGPPTVMLISLKAGALGLNLTCASQVFLMDPWWQASIEKQAIDRVYRIGQEKEVRVFQLIAEDTVESAVLEIQERKDLLIAAAFSGNKAASAATAKIASRAEDLKEIFGIKD